MTTLDNLQIVITADSRNIESILKRTIQSVTGTVNQINSQEIDWSSIFARSISPAIISGVATMFAYAIGQAMEFNATMNTLGTASGESTNQINDTANAALGLSTQVPQSAADIASAMTLVSTVFGTNTQATKDVVDAMSELSSSGFGSLDSIVSTSMGIFKEWGVTTKDQAIDVLTDLMHSAESAKETIPVLAEQFSPFSKSLVDAGANVSSFNGLLATFAAEIKDWGVPSATLDFQALTQSANDAVGPMEKLGVASQQTIDSLIKTGDITGILSKTSDILKSWGGLAHEVGEAFGFSTQQIDNFVQHTSKYPQIATDTKLIASNTESIGQAWAKAQTPLTDFEIEWNKLKADAIGAGTLFTPLLAGALKAFNSMTDGIHNWFNGVAKFIADWVTGQNPWQPLVSSLSVLKDDFLKNIGIVTTAIQQYFQQHPFELFSFLEATKNDFLKNLGLVANAIQSYLTSHPFTLLSKLESITSDFLNSIKSAWTSVQSWLQSNPLGLNFSNITSSITDTISNALSSAKNTISSMVSSASSAVSGLLSGGGGAAAPTPSTATLMSQATLSESDLNKKLGSLGFNSAAISSIDAKAGMNTNLINSLISALTTGIGTNDPYYAQINNQFNLSMPQGVSAQLTASTIANKLYSQFQGIAH